MDALQILKTYLGIALNDTSQDAILNLYIDRAKDLIDSFLGFPLEQSTYTEKVEFQRYIIPKAFPIISLTSLTINGEVQTLSDYYIDKDSGIVYKMKDYRINLLCPGLADIVYSAGYVSPYPGWVNECWAMTALYIKEFVYHTSGAGSGGSTGTGGSVSLGGINTITVNDIYSVSYHDNGISKTFTSSFKENGGKTPEDMYHLIPPTVMGILKMKRMRQYP